MKNLKIFVIFLLGIIAGMLVMNSNLNLLNKLTNKNKEITIESPTDKYSQLEKIDNILNQYFYDPEQINKENQMESAIKAYVDSIEDPYTVYLDSKQSSGLENSLKGEEDFEGIGAYITKKDDYIQIEELIKNGPAFKAGLLPLDHIIQIDETPVKDITIEEATNLLRGISGSKISVIIERTENNEKKLLTIIITREHLNVPSVNTNIINIDVNKNVLYIEIQSIGEETENIFKQELREFKNNDIDGIILDLRGNGGGLMNVATEIMSHFVEKGKILVSAKYKSFDDYIVYSEGYGDLEGLPITILIDGYSASAAEIIALGLKEQAGASIIGTQSFGKGTIQTIDTFDNGDSLKYTIGKRYSPNNENINNKGITPDIIIDFDSEKYNISNIDNQLESAKELLKKLIK